MLNVLLESLCFRFQPVMADGKLDDHVDSLSVGYRAAFQAGFRLHRCHLGAGDDCSARVHHGPADASGDFLG